MIKRTLTILAATAALALLAAAPASAAFGLKELDTSFSPQPGSSALEAGTHPAEFTTTLGVNARIVPEGAKGPAEEPVDGEVPEQEVKDLRVAQIPGLVGSQTAVPRCSSAAFNTRVEGRAQCPDSTAVGIVAVKAEFEIFPAGVNEYVHVPVYNLAPSPGEAAKLGFVALNVPIVIDVGLSESYPYELVAKLSDVPQAVLFYGSKLTIWGNPASPTHNTLRGQCVGDPLIPTKEPLSLGSCPTNVPEAPFLTLPRACAGPLHTLFSADSWQAPGAFTEPQSAFTHGEGSSEEEGISGCESLGFGPTAKVSPTSEQAESPAGLAVKLEVKDEGLTSPSGRARSDIRKVQITLPPGVTANPAAAEGLGACTSAQYNEASLAVPGCPSSAKLGSVVVRSPLLEEALEGSIYLATPEESPSGTMRLPLYMLLRNQPNGIFVKQLVRVEPDPRTGQLVSTVEEIPQLPFSSFTLRFREGPRAPLTTPPACGTYTTRAVLTPWSGTEAVESSSTFQVTTGPAGGPCPAGAAPPFAPGFEAGTLSNDAGSYSPLFMRLTRSDGEQDLTRFDALLPPGLVPKLAGIPRCSDAAIEAAKLKKGLEELASPSCPAASQIGRVEGGAGVGPDLTWVGGKVYLAGPFGGDPMSVVAIVPAVAGPFDVGTVVTREAINLNPVSYRGEIDGAASDPIPHILKGIPLKLRDLRVYADRPQFTLNPTGCEATALGATIFGSGADLLSPADDTPVARSAPFQAANCAALAFKPALKLTLKGATKRAGHPALHSILTPRSGDANIGGAVVTLPKTEFIDNAHINNPCTRVQFNADQCPPSSILGTARAITPLLDEPLEGPVYFRANGGERDLPDIVADLRGQFHIVLVGFVKTVTPKTNPRLQTTFQSVPDAPVKSFELNLFGGKRGLLINSANLCAKKRRVTLQLTGQNAKRTETTPVLATGCKSAKAKRHKRHR